MQLILMLITDLIKGGNARLRWYPRLAEHCMIRDNTKLVGQYEIE